VQVILESELLLYFSVLIIKIVWPGILSSSVYKIARRNTGNAVGEDH